MSIGVVDRKRLWTLSGNRCAFPGCEQSLVGAPPGGGEQHTIVGEEAHIRSSQEKGPRYDAGFPSASLDSYENLLLLCPTHHTLIDSQSGAGWTVQALIDMKAVHETQVEARRGPRDNRALATQLAVAARITDIEGPLFGLVSEGTWALNQALPRITKARLQSLIDLNLLLFRTDWPGDYSHIEAAASRLGGVLTALSNQVLAAFDAEEGYFEIARQYKRIGRWDPDAYQRLMGEFELNAATVWALTAELSRAANLFITAVRMDLDPMYRFDEGRALMVAGDAILGPVSVARLEYEAVDWSEVGKFPNLDRVKELIHLTALDRQVAADELDVLAIDFNSD